MTKNYQTKTASAVTADAATPDRVTIAMAELADAAEEGLLALAVGVGMIREGHGMSIGLRGGGQQPQPDRRPSPLMGEDPWRTPRELCPTVGCSALVRPLCEAKGCRLRWRKCGRCGRWVCQVGGCQGGRWLRRERMHEARASGPSIGMDPCGGLARQRYRFFAPFFLTRSPGGAVETSAAASAASGNGCVYVSRVIFGLAWPSQREVDATSTP